MTATSVSVHPQLNTFLMKERVYSERHKCEFCGEFGALHRGARALWKYHIMTKGPNDSVERRYLPGLFHNVDCLGAHRIHT